MLLQPFGFQEKTSSCQITHSWPLTADSHIHLHQHPSPWKTTSTVWIRGLELHWEKPNHTLFSLQRQTGCPRRWACALDNLHRMSQQLGVLLFHCLLQVGCTESIELVGILRSP